MDQTSIEQQHTETVETPTLLVNVGDAADLTLGEGGDGGESKRYVYN